MQCGTKYIVVYLIYIYVQTCNTFFMNVVSRLCFSGNETPHDDVIDKLLSYVTKAPGLETGGERLMSQQLSPFDDAIDPTPAVRSFLLQLLLRSRYLYWYWYH